MIHLFQARVDTEEQLDANLENDLTDKAIKIQAIARGRQGRAKAEEKLKEQMEGEMEAAATSVQVECQRPRVFAIAHASSGCSGSVQGPPGEEGGLRGDEPRHAEEDERDGKHHIEEPTTF